MSANKDNEQKESSDELHRVIREKTNTASGIASNVWGAVWGSVETLASMSYSSGKYLKDMTMNSSMMKWQVTQSFAKKSLPDSLESKAVFYESNPQEAQERPNAYFFTKTHFTGCFFEGAAISGIYPGIEVQFTNCRFDENTNFLGLAYHGVLGHPKIKERLMNPKNSNINGEKVITTIAEANLRIEALAKELDTEGKPDIQKYDSFVKGLIESVTLLQSGEKPFGYDDVMLSFQMPANLKMDFAEQKQIEIFKEKVKPLVIALELEETYLKLIGGKPGEVQLTDPVIIPGAQPQFGNQPNSAPASQPVKIGSRVIQRSPSLSDLSLVQKAPTIEELKQVQEEHKALNLQKGASRGSNGKDGID